MNSNLIFTPVAMPVPMPRLLFLAPATTSAAAEDAFKNDPTPPTLEGVRGKDADQGRQVPCSKTASARRRLHPDARLKRAHENEGFIPRYTSR